MNMPLIDVRKISELHDQLSEMYGVVPPDYFVLKAFAEIKNGRYTHGFNQIGGNVDYASYERMFLKNDAHRYYKPPHDVIAYQANLHDKVELIGVYHEFVHYKNQHKGIEESEEETEREAQELYKKDASRKDKTR